MPPLEIQVFSPSSFHPSPTRSARVAIDYPIGHRRRRAEGVPVLIEKFRQNLATRFDAARARAIEAACRDQEKLEALPVDVVVARLPVLFSMRWAISRS